MVLADHSTARGTWSSIGLSALRFDANIHARGHVEAGEGIHRLAGGLGNVDQTLVRPDLKLLPGLLVDVRATENRKALDAGRKRNRTANDGTGPLSGLDDVGCGLVEGLVVVGLHPDLDLLTHLSKGEAFAECENLVLGLPAGVSRKDCVRARLV